MEISNDELELLFALLISVVFVNSNPNKRKKQKFEVILVFLSIHIGQKFPNLIYLYNLWILFGVGNRNARVFKILG